MLLSQQFRERLDDIDGQFGPRFLISLSVHMFPVVPRMATNRSISLFPIRPIISAVRGSQGPIFWYLASG
jgi:hypothetical protein